MSNERIILKNVRAKQCAADTVWGFLAMWIPLSEEQLNNTLSHLLPLRVGNRAKYNCIIPFKDQLALTVGELTQEVQGGLVVVLQQEQNDTRRAVNVTLTRLDGTMTLAPIELLDSHIPKIRRTHVNTALEPQQEYLLNVDLKRH